jgi:hypothetical protein
MTFNDRCIDAYRIEVAALALCGALTCLVMPAHAGPGEAALAQASGERMNTQGKQTLWRIHEFTSLQLVPRETGSAENQHPAAIAPEVLRQQLGLVQSVARTGHQALFAPDELAELVGPLSQALSQAGPGNDVALVSASRHDGGILAEPTAVTARLFVQGGTLQFIVHDARLEFFGAYRGTHVEPKFTYGSRSAAGTVTLQSHGAVSKRPDWISIPLATTNAQAAAPSSTVSRSNGAAIPSAAARKPFDPAIAEEIERRLETLKRLRERNLITEEEYQQKRQEILQLL